MVSKRYLLTCAVNNVKADLGCLEALKAYAAHRRAELLIAPVHYKNPTSQAEDAEHEEGEWWDDAVEPYLVGGKIRLGETKCVFHADARVQPTAARPCNGREVFLGKESAVIPHPKHELKFVADGSKYPRMVASTGAITLPVYGPSRAGQLAQRCHTVGALWVETRGKLFFAHQITWNRGDATEDGHFTHLATNVLGRADGECGIAQALPAEAIVLGDLHAAQIDMEAFQAGMSQAQLTRAKRVVLHDVFDGLSISHHHTLADKQRGLPTLDDELDKTAEILIMAARWVKQWGGEIVIAHSNHDRHLDRWLLEHRPDGGRNDLAWYELNAMAMRGKRKVPAFELAMGIYISAMLEQHDMDPEGIAPITFLRPGEELIVCNIALHIHGDRGPNGARGTPAAFAKLGRKVTHGHVHTPGILDGAHTVGVTGRRDMPYTIGAPSSWMAANDVIHADGHRSILPIVGGEW